MRGGRQEKKTLKEGDEGKVDTPVHRSPPREALQIASRPPWPSWRGQLPGTQKTRSSPPALHPRSIGFDKSWTNRTDRIPISISTPFGAYVLVSPIYKICTTYSMPCSPGEILITRLLKAVLIEELFVLHFLILLLIIFAHFFFCYRFSWGAFSFPEYVNANRFGTFPGLLKTTKL